MIVAFLRSKVKVISKVREQITEWCYAEGKESFFYWDSDTNN